eukprot:5112773-Pleurochrysis_carterae.AAC.4
MRALGHHKDEVSNNTEPMEGSLYEYFKKVLRAPRSRLLFLTARTCPHSSVDTVNSQRKLFADFEKLSENDPRGPSDETVGLRLILSGRSWPTATLSFNSARVLAFTKSLHGEHRGEVQTAYQRQCQRPFSQWQSDAQMEQRESAASMRSCSTRYPLAAISLPPISTPPPLPLSPFVTPSLPLFSFLHPFVPLLSPSLPPSTEPPLRFCAGAAGQPLRDDDPRHQLGHSQAAQAHHRHDGDTRSLSLCARVEGRVARTSARSRDRECACAQYGCACLRCSPQAHTITTSLTRILLQADAVLRLH